MFKKSGIQQRCTSSQHDKSRKSKQEKLQYLDMFDVWIIKQRPDDLMHLAPSVGLEVSWRN